MDRIEKALGILQPDAATRDEVREELIWLAEAFREALEAEEGTPKPSEVSGQLAEIEDLADRLGRALRHGHVRTKGALLGTWPRPEGSGVREDMLPWIAKGGAHAEELARLRDQAAASRHAMEAMDLSPRGLYRELFGDPRAALAYDAARVLKRYGIRPSSTEDGLLAELMRALLEQAGRPDKARGLHNLLKRVIPELR